MSGTYTFRELIRAAGITSRTGRYYFERRVLPPPVLRGQNTTYTDEHLTGLRAIRRLRTVERLHLDAIRKRLSASSPEEIRALAEGPSVERPGVRMVPVLAATVSAPATPAGADLRVAVAGEAPSPQMGSGGQLWERIELLPGLELHVKKESGALVQRLSREIQAHYGLAPGGAVVLAP